MTVACSSLSKNIPRTLLGIAEQPLLPVKELKINLCNRMIAFIFATEQLQKK
jgi:hypothetical protein